MNSHPTPGKGHVAAFGTFGDLSDLVDGEPILDNIGLIVKTCNEGTNARMILDTKQSGAKHVTSQAQRVTLPRLFDAILQLLFLLTCVAAGAKGILEAVKAFVLDFSDAFWQIPINPAEQKYFCAI